MLSYTKSFQTGLYLKDFVKYVYTSTPKYVKNQKRVTRVIMTEII